MPGKSRDTRATQHTMRDQRPCGRAPSMSPATPLARAPHQPARYSSVLATKKHARTNAMPTQQVQDCSARSPISRRTRALPTNLTVSLMRCYPPRHRTRPPPQTHPARHDTPVSTAPLPWREHRQPMRAACDQRFSYRPPAHYRTPALVYRAGGAVARGAFSWPAEAPRAAPKSRSAVSSAGPPSPPPFWR